MIEQWTKDGHVVNKALPLSQEEFKKALLEKLIEETDEVVAAESVDQIAKELADVYEVIDVIIKTYGLSKETIIEYQKEKRAHRGTFANDTFVKTFSPLPQSDQEAYCLANIHRAPEIVE